MPAVTPRPAEDYPFKWLPDGTAVETSEPPPSRADRPKAKWVTVAEWVVLIGIALAIALIVKTFLFQAFYIPSDSMDPTLKTGDRVIVNKLSYDLHAVHRGDIVVFHAPKGPDGKSVDPGINILVKRVVGLPGETIEGRLDGRIYINGKRLREPYLHLDGRNTSAFPPFVIPKDSYWVMGDNRGNSRDSRFFPNHTIPKKDIIGRVFLRIWPLQRIGIL